MKLNQEQRDLVLKKIESFISKSCFSCDSKEWILNETLFELREFQGGNLILGEGGVFPVFTITCSKCGHTNFFNAITLGVVNKKNDEKKS